MAGFGMRGLSDITSCLSLGVSKLRSAVNLALSVAKLTEMLNKISHHLLFIPSLDYAFI
jgi:hypothetical protein